MANTRRTQWTEAVVRAKIAEVMDALKLDRMPTRAECVAYFGDNRLACAIGRRYGWYNLASKLCIDIKECETNFGKHFEATAADMLTEIGLDVVRMPQNFPYDLLVNSCIKVDVKASRLYRGKLGNFYTYNLEKPYTTCDFYILYAINDDGCIDRAMVVPSCLVATNTQISVGQNNSKYHKFTNRFDLIINMARFWSFTIGGDF